MADTPSAELGAPSVEVETNTGNDNAQVPGMSVMDTIIADTNAALVQSSSVEAKVAANMGAMEAASNELVVLNQQNAQDKALVTSVNEAAKLKAQQYTIAAANKAGVDPNKASDFLLSTIDKFRESAAKTQERLKIYNEKRDSKFADDPVKWLIDGLTLHSAGTDLKIAADTTQTLGNQVQAINGIIQQTASTSMQIKESTSAAAADAATRMAANEANQAAVQQSINSIKYNSAALESSMNATKERLGIMYNAKNAQMQESNQKIVLQKFEQDKREFEWRKEEKNIANQAKSEGKDVDAYVIEQINVGRAVRGLPPLTGPGIKANLQLFKSGGSKELAMDFKNGEHTTATGNAMLAASPAEALDNIKNNTVNIAPARERAISILQQAENALAKNPVLAGSKDQDAKNKFINEFVAAEVKNQYANGTKGPMNMFDVGDISGYFGISAVANLPVTKKLLMPASQAGTKLEDPKVVIDLAVAAVRKGTITSNDFTDIASVYQMANDINLRASNPLGLGIQLPNGGRNYFVKTQMFGSPLDITNPTELGRYMSKQLAAQLGQKQTEDARAKYGTPGTPNAMRRMMWDQRPNDPDDLKQGQ